MAIANLVFVIMIVFMIFKHYVVSFLTTESETHTPVKQYKIKAARRDGRILASPIIFTNCSKFAKKIAKKVL